MVEALAARIASGAVPPRLAGAHRLLQPSALVAGAGVVGELDKRMRKRWSPRQMAAWGDPVLLMRCTR
ncbi:MAG: hypothetical protein IPK85_06925 [Gemmatimonadetes bacterium]|nr:hypothetical protein [Gemmatimonadota bacterium]